MNTNPEDSAPDKEDDIALGDFPKSGELPCPPKAVRCTDGCFRDKKWVRKYGTAEDKNLL